MCALSLSYKIQLLQNDVIHGVKLSRNPHFMQFYGDRNRGRDIMIVFRKNCVLTFDLDYMDG